MGRMKITIRPETTLLVMLLGLLGLVILFITVQLFRGYIDTRTYADMIFPSTLAMAGMAMGFSFGGPNR